MMISCAVCCIALLLVDLQVNEARSAVTVEKEQDQNNNIGIVCLTHNWSVNIQPSLMALISNTSAYKELVFRRLWRLRHLDILGFFLLYELKITLNGVTGTKAHSEFADRFNSEKSHWKSLQYWKASFWQNGFTSFIDWPWLYTVHIYCKYNNQADGCR